jgi:hypothetical protein
MRLETNGDMGLRREESPSGMLVAPNRTNPSRSTSKSGRSGSSDVSVPWPSWCPLGPHHKPPEAGM